MRHLAKSTALLRSQPDGCRTALAALAVAAGFAAAAACAFPSTARAELRTSGISLGYGKSSPSACPDGKRLAFGWAASDKKGSDVFVMEIADTSKAPIPVTDSPKRDNRPSWSPDGTRIAFMSGRSGDEDIWVVDVATLAATQMTFSPWGPYDRAQEFGPAWSPDGSRIAFSSDRSGDDDIWWVPAAGGEMVRVTKRTLPFVRDEDRFPSWSPDGKRIVYTSKTAGNWDLWIAVVDDTAAAPVQLTTDPAEEYLPAWSPNGRWIAFVSMREGQADVYVIPAEGGEALKLTQNPGPDSEPCWSPDGRRIYYTSSRQGQGHGIWAIDGLEDLLGKEFAAPPSGASRRAERTPAAGR